MHILVYSFYDSKTGLFSQPFYSVRREAAMRAAIDWCRDPQSSMFPHLEDYTLFELGLFDDNTGVMTSHTAPENLGLMGQLVLPKAQGGN